MKLALLIRRFGSKAKIVITGGSSFNSSTSYWEERYRNGGNSGSGAYGRLANFKASTLNEFVINNGIQSVIEFGSGDGAQLSLAKYPHYTGVDVSPTILDSTRKQFADRPSIRFLHASEVTPDDRAELALSLDVIYHLIEDEVFENYMQHLFNAATRFVIIYSSDVEEPSPTPHVKQRQFTRWVGANQPDFELVKKIPNPWPYSEKDPDTTWSDFYTFARTQAPPPEVQLGR